MSFAESVYHRLPVGVQHIVTSAIGARLRALRYGGDFKRIAAEFAADPLGRKAGEVGSARLRKFLAEDVPRAPWYAEHGFGTGFPGQFPVLASATVRANVGRFVAEPQPGQRTLLARTSGTTGAGLVFPVTMSAVRAQWAVWWRYRSWHGISQDTWCGYFGGRSIVPSTQQAPPFHRINFPGRQVLLSGYHLSPGTVAEYVHVLRQRKPPWLHGYPSLIAAFASLVREQGLELGYRPKWVTTGAESLLAHQAEVIEDVLGVRPLQHYGMAEGVANFSECESRLLHVDEDFAHVEFLEGDETGHRVVGTNFWNAAFPLVRYDTGDRAVLEAAGCRCGRSGRVVASVEGRREDYVVLPSGALVGRLDHVFKEATSIREAQIRQDRIGEVELLVVPGRGFCNDTITDIVAEARTRLGPEMTIKVAVTDRVPRTGTGKIKFVVAGESVQAYVRARTGLGGVRSSRGEP